MTGYGMLENREIIKCIDEQLDIFGANIKYTLYWKMRILHDTPRREILHSPEILIQELRDILGEGSAFVEDAVGKKIRDKLGLEDLSETLSELILRATNHVAEQEAPERSSSRNIVKEEHPIQNPIST
jgi:hypothetical protein